jgi:hypothetical protein
MRDAPGGVTLKVMTRTAAASASVLRAQQAMEPPWLGALFAADEGPWREAPGHLRPPLLESLGMT